MMEGGWQPFMGHVYGVRLLGDVEYRYVGLTTKTLVRRKSEHFKLAARGRKTAFADWLRKQPDREMVHFQSLELVLSDLEDLSRAEQDWIRMLREEGHRLLNLNDGGRGNHGYRWTAEQRAAASERSRGRRNPSYLSGPDHPRWGASHSDEQKALWSEQRKGMNAGPLNPNYGKFGSDHPSFGHTMSPESRRRLSEMRRGPLNPNYGKTASEETRAKRSAALKGRPMPSSVRSAHTRYHANKGVVKESCQHCRDDADRTAEQGESRG